ncbi:MAG: histidine phosphatase family protein [Paracoccaceae bacterium]|nr:histidine phosphatase family protein [Paracoccaceae bacterium]
MRCHPAGRRSRTFSYTVNVGIDGAALHPTSRPLPPPLIIFRHGQTEWNREGIFQGRLDSPLTAMGRQQAEGLTALIAPLLGDQSWSAFTSPTGRSKTTANLALGPLGIEASQDDRLVEVDVGDWSGLTAAEMMETAGVDVPDNPFLRNYHAPNGESFDAMCSRVQSFLSDLTGPTIISTHGITSRVLRGLVLGLDQEGMRTIEGGQGCVLLIKDGKQQRFG